MPTVTIRVDQRTKDDLEALASGRNQTISDVVRPALDALLGRETRTAPDLAPVSLSAFERRQLALTHRILAILNGGVEEFATDADEELARAHVLEEGYTAEYSREFAGIYPELSRAESKLVMDILDMFSLIKAGLRAPENQPVDDEVAARLRFRGFDRNDPRESRLLDYARYLIADGRWVELADVFSSENDNGNSHMPFLDAFQRMLRAFVPIRESLRSGRGERAWVLSNDDLRQLAVAATHPSQRGE
ncbi:YfbU family protein [Plantibacter sp. CFBP 8775]|uniref:YfbU family protein n=1 Tax=Plantibacter sp. CFBP 8775 TaxID=2774038 RepID=UPI0017847654|nr:YfbU family protein [Plantibacter sp. CFBP 8775]MBD8104734.1 YfbU family protein [Plantibacter sp. CFBP 8775]